MDKFSDAFLEWLGNLLADIVNGLLQEEGYEEPFWKTVILLLPRCIFAIIALPILAVIFLLDALHF